MNNILPELCVYIHYYIIYLDLKKERLIQYWHEKNTNINKDCTLCHRIKRAQTDTLSPVHLQVKKYMYMYMYFDEYIYTAYGHSHLKKKLKIFTNNTINQNMGNYNNGDGIIPFYTVCPCAEYVH